MTESISPPPPRDAGATAKDIEGVATEIVRRLPRDPVHLWQLNQSPGTYNNAMGCGAFSTAMALSYYDPTRFGTYDAARRIVSRMAW
jgi:hypothetical protein